ncbi:MucBP domain-containing protein [Lactobacillus bombicola]|uniref:MucBP domain-containing protein n=1 Tax=Lactobacillus bombicola TaxID=1505723 RepID=UPI000E580DD7|nr:MucBP domain-containing protein [Lactobacillus bombicola]RHW50611.1 hypothetical protein DS833_04875 [Lactobacillus bombicola]
MTDNMNCKQSDLNFKKATKQTNLFVKASKAKRLIFNYVWNEIPVFYNDVSKVLTIPGGTEVSPTILNNPKQIYSIFGAAGQNDVKQIKIIGKLKIIGSAEYMFSYLKKLTLIVGLANIDTTEVTNMSGLFNYCCNLKTIDVSNFDTSNVTNMHGMFGNCYNLTSLNIEKFNTTKVTDMGEMFSGCANIKKLDLSHFDMRSIPRFNQAPIGSDDQSTFAMLSGMTKLKILKLNNNCDLKNSNMDGWLYREGVHYGQPIDSRWVNLDGGTITDAKGSNIWYPCEMSTKYQVGQDTDTYIRFGIVTTQYRDEDGNVLAPNHVRMGLIDEQYTDVSSINISGYVIKNIIGKTSDRFTDRKNKVITFVYTKAQVFIQFVDEIGAKIVANEVLKGKIGDEYHTLAKTIPGYTLKEIKGSVYGYFTKIPQSVAYVYSKNVINDAIKDEVTKPKLNNKSKDTINELSPKTRAKKRENIAVLSLGGTLLLSVVSIFWLKHKKLRR